VPQPWASCPNGYVFDLLTKPKPKLSKTQEAAVKKVARELLEKLQDQLAVAEWQTKQQTRAAVQSTIRFTLDQLPQEPYPDPIWNEKVEAVWAFIFARQAAARGTAGAVGYHSCWHPAHSACSDSLAFGRKQLSDAPP